MNERIERLEAGLGSLQNRILELEDDLRKHKQFSDTVNQKASICFKTLGESLTAIVDDVNKIKSDIIPTSNS